MPSPKGYKRDYKQEKRTSDARGEKKKRANRNKARRKLANAGVNVKGKDVDHKNGNTSDNSRKNLRAIAPSKNRSVSRKKKARKKK